MEPPPCEPRVATHRTSLEEQHMSTTLTAEQVPLDKPLYGATFGQAISRFFKKYATFSGRASRSEYWWWVLASAIISAVLSWLS
jgi:hypothetical protein